MPQRGAGTLRAGSSSSHEVRLAQLQARCLLFTIFDFLFYDNDEDYCYNLYIIILIIIIIIIIMIFCSQRTQYPVIKAYTLNRSLKDPILLGIFLN